VSKKEVLPTTWRRLMLVLTRKPGEKVVIGNNIILTVIKSEGNQVRLAFEAPPQVRILREEVLEREKRALLADSQPVDSEGDVFELVLAAQQSE